MANTEQRQVARTALDTDAMSITVDASPIALAASPDAVWWRGRAQDGGLVARIDALANQVERFRLPHPPSGLAVTRDGRTAWVATAGRRGQRRGPEIPVGNGPTGIAFGEDRVWVANSRDGTVSRSTPRRDVGTVHLGFRPAAVAVEQGAVWVALAG